MRRQSLEALLFDLIHIKAQVTQIGVLLCRYQGTEPFVAQLVIPQINHLELIQEVALCNTLGAFFGDVVAGEINLE